MKRIELTDRGVLLSLRWLVFFGLLFLSLFSANETRTVAALCAPLAIALIYAGSNLILTWMISAGLYPFRGSSAPVFLLDLSLVSAVLYTSVGLDTDLYLICFVVIYLATLGKSMKDAVPLGALAVLLYIAFLWKQNPSMNWMDPKLLLRFPFLFILTIFTTYLSQAAEKNRLKVSQMEVVQNWLRHERDTAVRELDKKQAELVQAEKLSAMGHMAGAMAHEIRNPLCVILGYASEILDSLPADHPHHKLLEIMHRCATRCNELAEKLLRFSRRPQEAETFDLNGAVDEAVTLARLGKKHFGVTFKLELKDGIEIIGRRNELQQMVVNLCTNAIDAMPQGGTITVQTSTEPRAGRQWAVIAVQDTGMGIPEELRKKIFDPFFTTKPAGVGTGLGLSIVRDIAQSLGGVLEVDSLVGKGTTFWIRLPLQNATNIAVGNAGDPSSPALS